ncbi:hypothetical protein MMC07_007174 [Pseudocyphellaria aurata]|nr:hypothetical protein [Pseudocyphellaria aurata]
MKAVRDRLRDELRTHSRYIRDNLVPLVARGAECQLNSRDLALLQSTLDRIDAIPMTISLLSYSRIDKALLRIAPTCTKWPAEIARQAHKTVSRWEEELGPLRDLRADLWGPGGRLEGVRKLDKNLLGTELTLPDISAFLLERECSKGISPSPFITDSRFSWWITAAAAFRDGIIDETSLGITANEHRAFAIVLTGKEEFMTDTDGLIRYSTSGSDPGVFKLTKTVLGHVRGVVRVLRSWKLKSPLAPVAGLRYDGLYRVVGYGVTLLQNQAGKDDWRFCFSLQREPGQTSMKEALAHPLADEIDDWNDYQLTKSGPRTHLIRSVYGDPDVDHAIGFYDGTRRDSGYSSRRPSGE